MKNINKKINTRNNKKLSFIKINRLTRMGYGFGEGSSKRNGGMSTHKELNAISLYLCYIQRRAGYALRLPLTLLFCVLVYILFFIFIPRVQFFNQTGFYLSTGVYQFLNNPTEPARPRTHTIPLSSIVAFHDCSHLGRYFFFF